MFKLLKNLNKIDYLYIFLAFCCIIIQVWLDLTMPDYTKELTRVVTDGSVQMSDVWYNGGMMLLCALGSACGFIACTFLFAKVASSFSKNTRIKIFDQILSFSSKEMNKFSIPSLITRTTNDVDQMYRFLAMGLQIVLKAPILAIWAITKISLTNVEWSLATIICVVIMVTLILTLILCCLPKFRKMQTLTDNLNNATRENLEGIRAVRAFNAEDYQKKKFEKANEELTNNQMFTVKAMGLLMPILMLCMDVLMLAIYWIASFLICGTIDINDKATIFSNMVAFNQYAMQVVMAFIMLVAIFVILPRAIVSAKRINEVLDTKSSITSGNVCNAEIKEGEPTIEFENVNFAFTNSKEDVLSNINFKAYVGKTLALIGATGSGKSTILNLLVRNYDVKSGIVKVLGENVKNYDIEKLNDKVALINQKAILFEGTIKSNVIYGSDNEVSSTDENLIKALKIAQADFVFDLPKGVDSEVAQGGTNFSGGQKQRIAIARAIYKNADIIVFDDSFSALDYKTDAKLRSELKKNLKDKTIIIVAQRIGTIMDADNILVIDNGKIVEQGTHKELIQNSTIYKAIALSQLSKEEL